jgi:anti-sigma factor (TIGR02949 family)
MTDTNENDDMHDVTGMNGMSPMKGMLDCHTVMRELWDYLDGALTPDRVEAIEAHLKMCARCYPQYEFERTFLDQVGRLRREHSDLSGLRARLLDVLRAHGFATA